MFMCCTTNSNIFLLIVLGTEYFPETLHLQHFGIRHQKNFHLFPMMFAKQNADFVDVVKPLCRSFCESPFVTVHSSAGHICNAPVE
jgi:hypothetical protein